MSYQDDKGRTALHLAAAQGRIDLVKSFLEEGRYDVMVSDNNGNSPLHYCGHVDTIRCLADYGAEPFARNQHGDTPLELMKRRGVEKEAIQAMEELATATKYRYNGAHCSSRSQSCLSATLCKQSILSEFCSDIGLKRLIFILVIILCLSFYVAYKATGMSKPTDQILVDEEVSRFEL